MKSELRYELASSISEATGLEHDRVSRDLEQPKNREYGDIAFPCFSLAKSLKKSPALCASELCSKIKLPKGFQSAQAVGPFINFSFERKLLAESVLKDALNPDSSQRKDAKSQNIIVEYSSPNIAKPFHVGHLRTTLIGNALDKIYRSLGYTVISINHLGDWGTQFGFVWAGAKLWGRPTNATIEDLVNLYRQATSLKEEQEEILKNNGQLDKPDVNEMARSYFVNLEQGAAEAVEFWKWCLDISLKYLQLAYQRLGITFDHYTGESFYSDKLDAVREELRSAGKLEESAGALGVDLGEQLGFARIATPDGRSLYLTRDLAAAIYRAKTFAFDRAVYVVGAPQTLHFEQLKEILRRLHKDYADKIIHVPFGHVIGMKTRGGGEIVELNNFLDEAMSRALHAYREQVTKRPAGLDEAEVAEAVAIAAIIFSNISRSRIKDVHFSWEHALEFQGDTGPYVLYAHARINGIKEKALGAGLTVPRQIDSSLVSDEASFLVVSLIDDFEQVLLRVIDEHEPAHLANYALELAKAVSKAYLELKVIGEQKELAQARLYLFEAARLKLSQSITLLGMKALERM